MRITPWLLACAALAAAVGPLPARAAQPGFQAPLVIGHRGGGNGYVPEHTLESYALGIELGADYVEPDLVATKDGFLIARHEPNLVATTDVASRPEFASRRRIAVVDGVSEAGFFASDFTLAEIRTLRAVQPDGQRDPRFDGRFGIPTFDEVIELAQRKSKEKNRPIGVYPETKHPTYHQQLGLALEDRVVAALDRAGWNKREAPVFIQSFETANLRYLRTKTPVKLVQLIDANDVNADGSLDFSAPYDRPYDWTVSGRTQLYSYLTTPAGLAEVKTYADGIGPWKPYIISNRADGTLLAPSSVVADAHGTGLVVHPYTFRNERSRLAVAYNGNPAAEYLRFYEAGVDGVFSDFADTAVAARAMLRLEREPAYRACLLDAGACPKD